MKKESEIAHLEKIIEHLNRKVLELSEGTETAESRLKKSERLCMRMESAIKSLEEVHRVQSYSVKGHYDDYNQGLYNGLELALSIICDRKPVYKQPCRIEAPLTISGEKIAKMVCNSIKEELK